MRIGASNAGNEGRKGGQSCALPRQHAGQARGRPHLHRINRTEDKLPEAWARVCPSRLAGEKHTRRSGCTRTYSSCRVRRRNIPIEVYIYIYSSRGTRIICWALQPQQQAQARLSVEAGGLEGCCRQRGGYYLPPLGARLEFCRSFWQTPLYRVRRPSEEGAPRIERDHSDTR